MLLALLGVRRQRNRDCCCVSVSDKVLSVSDSERVLSVSDNEGVLSVSDSEGVLLALLGVTNQRIRKCCCVRGSTESSISGSEGVLLCIGQPMSTECIIQRGSIDCIGQRVSAASAVGCEKSKD